jgi:hypothetical protein
MARPSAVGAIVTELDRRCGSRPTVALVVAVLMPGGGPAHHVRLSANADVGRAPDLDPSDANNPSATSADIFSAGA